MRTRTLTSLRSLASVFTLLLAVLIALCLLVVSVVPGFGNKLRLKPTVSTAVGLAGLIGSLIGIYQFVLPMLQTTPQAVMTGDLNIAIAEFGELGPDGRVAESSEARSLSDSVHREMAKQVAEVAQARSLTPFDIQVRQPTEVGLIAGSTRADRAREAERLAQRLRADIVVYGNLRSDSSGNRSFAPEFYLSPQKLRDAEELAGQYEFGGEVASQGDLARNPVVRQQFREQVLTRTRALTQFVMGLGYYTIGQMDEASEYLRSIEQAGTWENCPCEVVLYLFEGNVSGKRGDLDSAERYYARALSLDPDYARALFGAAEVTFQRSRRDCEAGNTDVAGLKSALSGYQDAARQPDQPPYSNISTKAAYLQGRVLVCLSQALEGDYWSDAERALLLVTKEFDGGNEAVRELAADAHAYLGLVYLPTVGEAAAEAKYRQATAEYRKAISLTSRRERQRAYYLMLADALRHLGLTQEAEEAAAKAH